MSNRAALIAVITAFAVGLLGSLAVRPAPEQSIGTSAQGLREVRWRLPVAVLVAGVGCRCWLPVSVAGVGWR